MATCVATSPSTASSPRTVEAFLCDNCRCPIGSVWDVLPAEAHAPAWRDHVYSYELDLFANGAAPIQAYSATNPSKRRFDLLRLAPDVTVHDAPTAATTSIDETTEKNEKATDATVSRALSFVVCDTAVYSSEHSFFTGYAWCFCTCGNCGAFLGWGFAAEERLRAAARTRAREGGEDNNDGDAEAGTTSSRRRVDTTTPAVVDGEGEGEGDTGSTPPPASSLTTSGTYSTEDSSDEVEEESDDDEEEEEAEKVEEFAAAGVTPDFIGIIITHCTGEPSYPVDSVQQEIEWRPWRVRRCQRVQAISKEITQLLRRADDSLFAHRVYYAFEAVVRGIFHSPPPTAHPVVGEDDVPMQLLEVLELARTASGRRRVAQRASEHVEEREEEGDEESSGDEEGDAYTTTRSPELP